MDIAVITGASSGMGREFVYAIDKEYELKEIWVVARRKERLEELQTRCRTKIRPLVLDLSAPASFTEYKALLEANFAKADPDWDKKPDIKWNFTKFVVDREGNVVARFEPTADIDKVEACIKSLLSSAR